VFDLRRGALEAMASRLLYFTTGEISTGKVLFNGHEDLRWVYFQHLARCSHPAAVMLDIQTTLIVVSLPGAYGYWHSLYLDQHGEEDPKLK
jgi:hypothetical protein